MSIQGSGSNEPYQKLNKDLGKIKLLNSNEQTKLESRITKVFDESFDFDAAIEVIHTLTDRQYKTESDQADTLKNWQSLKDKTCLLFDEHVNELIPILRDNPRNFSKTVCDIKQENTRMLVLLNCAKEQPALLASNIQKIGITNPDALLQIALICAEKEPNRLLKHIGDFKITDQDALVTIALICAEKRPTHLIKEIQKFKITDQDALVTIALKCAEKVPEWLTQHIENFGIRDQEALVQIALKCSEEGAANLVIDYIGNFKITEQAGLVTVALKCIERSASYFVRRVKNFGITDQKDFLKIAFICAQVQPKFLNDQINKFKTTDPKGLLETVLIYAQEKTDLLAQHIKMFEITDQNFLKKIALTCIAKDPRSLAKHIKNFGIEDQKDLKEIALTCVEKDSRSLTEHIKNFGIEDQKDLKEIALTCVEKDSRSLTEHIKNFGIEDQKDLKEIAITCVEKDSRSLTEHIKNFGIEDQKDLKEMASQCFKQIPCVATHFKTLGEKDQSEWFEILVEGALNTHDYSELSFYISTYKNFGFDNLLGNWLDSSQGNNYFELQKSNFSKFPFESLIRLHQKIDKNDRAKAFFEDSFTILLLNLHPEFKESIHLSCPDIQVMDIQTLTEKAQGVLEAASKQSESQKSDIPDLAKYKEVPYGAIEQIFASFTNEDLTGIIGINESMLTADAHRINFDYFLNIVKTNTSITGATTANAEVKYEPFKRLIKHLATELPQLPKNEQISLLTQFSYINQGTCIDPYIKSTKFIYNMIKDEKSANVSVQTPVEKLQDDLRARQLIVRDTQFSTAVKNTREKPIDTHSENWAKNALAQDVGYEIISDEEDPFLYSGRLKLSDHLLENEVEESKLVEHLKTQFNKGLVLKSFESFSKILDDILDPKPTSSGKEEFVVTSETISDYFHQLLDNDFAASLHIEKQGLENKGLVDSYVTSSIQIPPTERKLEVLKGDLENGDSALKSRLEKAIKNGKAEQQEILEEQITKKEKEIEAALNSISEKKQGVAKIKEALGEVKCKALDKLIDEKKATETAFSQEWISEEDVLDPVTKKPMLNDKNMKITRESIEAKGQWKLFTLFMDDEIRGAARLTAP